MSKLRCLLLFSLMHAMHMLSWRKTSFITVSGTQGNDLRACIKFKMYHQPSFLKGSLGPVPGPYYHVNWNLSGIEMLLEYAQSTEFFVLAFWLYGEKLHGIRLILTCYVPPILPKNFYYMYLSNSCASVSLRMVHHCNLRYCWLMIAIALYCIAYSCWLLYLFDQWYPQIAALIRGAKTHFPE